MPPSSVEPGDLLDLKLMPAWVKEPSARQDYSEYEGEKLQEVRERRPQGSPRREQLARKNRPAAQGYGGREAKGPRRSQDQRRGPRVERHQQTQKKRRQPVDVAVQFLPRPLVLENVVSQVKAESLAYSLFFLARSFLEKPQRYDVRLKGKPESPLYR